MRKHKAANFLRILIYAATVSAMLAMVGCGEGNTNNPDDVKYPDDAVIIQEDTAFPVLIPAGCPAVADLDGDGENDIVNYGVSPAEEGQMAVLNTFAINGKEFKDTDDLFRLTIMEAPRQDGFYIVDIDESDNLLEIAIMDEGPSSDPVTYFYRYNGVKAYCIGEVPDFPDAHSCTFNGDGSITARLRLDVLQTWWASATWRLNQRDSLERTDQDAFIPYDAWNTSSLLEDLPLYESKDQSAGTVVAPKGSAVTFLETDNRHWLKIKAGGGETGWVYLKDFSTVTVDGTDIPTVEIFKDLSFAD